MKTNKSLTELLKEADEHIKKAERLKAERLNAEEDLKAAKSILYSLLAEITEEGVNINV